MRYESSDFGAEYRDNLFAALFNLHKVTRHELKDSGSTFTTEDSDFLAAADFDFHPTDVLEDADGSLLVVDTGGWYKLCCPTSQLIKPDVLGAIYRVRWDLGERKYSAAVRKKINHARDPWGKTIDLASLSARELYLLQDSNRPAVARRAADELVRRGHDAVKAARSLELSLTSERRYRDIWILTQIDDPLARRFVRLELPLVVPFGKKSEATRHAAILSTALWRDRDAVPQLIELLSTDTSANRRAAAEALGRIGDPIAVPALLTAVGHAQDDQVLEHSLIYALIEIGDPTSVTSGLKSPNVHTRRAALIALDQMPGDHLSPETLTQFLTADDLDLADTATWIAGRHPQWAEHLAGYFRGRLEADDIEGTAFVPLERQLAAFAGSKVIQELLAERLGDVTASDAMCRFVLQTMAQARLKTTPESWIGPLRRAVASHNAAVVAEAVRTARSLTVPPTEAGELAAALVKIARSGERDPDLRLDALAAVPGGLAEADAEIFALLRAQVQPNGLAGRRMAAAGVLAKAKLSSEQLVDLTTEVGEAGPLEIEKLLAAFAQSKDPRVGLKLVEVLPQARSRAALRIETLKPLLEKFGPQIEEPAQALYAALAADSEQQRAGLEALLAQLQDGDVRRGQVIFNSSKAACASCHAIGYVGGNIGPDLTRIGQIRTQRDLLESIVFPRR